VRTYEEERRARREEEEEVTCVRRSSSRNIIDFQGYRLRSVQRTGGSIAEKTSKKVSENSSERS